MHDGHCKDAWNYVSHVMATIYNHVRTQNDKLLSVDLFNPYAVKQKKPKQSGWHDAEIAKKEWMQAAKKQPKKKPK